MKDKWCTPEHPHYPTFDEAKEACTNDNECKYFYDESGDGIAPFIVCRGDSVELLDSGAGSIVYAKCKGLYINPSFSPYS